MSDLIDRQKAIDALIDALAWTWSGTWSEKAAIDAIKNLPSAQPKIIYCGDCRYKRFLLMGRKENRCRKVVKIFLIRWYTKVR